MYLNASGQGGPDATIVWTSEVDWEPIKGYVQQYNSLFTNFISSTHVLVQAVGRALALHPEMNRRVVGRRVYEYAHCNVCLATRVPNDQEVYVIQIKNADALNIRQISHLVSRKQLDFARGIAPDWRDTQRLQRLPSWLASRMFRTLHWVDRWLVIPVWGRVDRLRESVVLINDFSHPRFPLMRSYKPSRQPGDSKPLSVTLGRVEEKVIWASGQAAVKQVAPLTVRVDHRVCDSFQLAMFIQTITRLLQNPAQMETDNRTEVVSDPDRTVNTKRSA